MNDWSENFYIFLCGAALLLTAMGLGVAVIMPSIERWSKRFFITFFSVLLMAFSIALAELILIRFPGTTRVLLVADFLMTLFCSIPLPMLTAFLLHSCGEDWRNSPLSRAALILWVLFVLLLIVAPFTPFFYSLAPDNQVVYGPGYPLLIAPTVVIELINLAGLFRRRDWLSRKLFVGMLISLVPMTVALNVHLFVPVFPLIDTAFALSALSMYGIILSDEIEQYMRQQRQIAHQSANIMALQMRPHFIHNTMMSIYYLCQQDPAEAQRVTLNFNTYLEKNLNAMASDETIPFTEELEHTRAYLNVEQALYDENLFVDYDTPHTDFRLPPLTLQPIVENAVKHALDPDSDPIRIRIRTRETDSGSEITVSDNGPGYAPTDDDKPHIALANIRQRLELMCGGEMAIASREGGGTVVRLTIPRAARRTGRGGRAKLQAIKTPRAGRGALR